MENAEGWTGRWRYSTEPEHLAFISNFLREFLGVSFADVMRDGGLDSLVGREIEVEVEFPDGVNPQFQPVWE